jgi:MYXO-CTERM domain-containing protein
MKRRTVLSLIALVALQGAAQAAVILPNLPAGSQYRLVFPTTGTYQSYNSTTPSQTRSLSYWQGVVDAEKAASTSATVTGSTFSIVGSIFNGSSTVLAQTITGMSDTVSDNIPVYNTNGELVAANSVAFWATTHAAAMNYDRNGVITNGNAWVGWWPTLQGFRPLGHATQTYYSSTTSTNWLPGPTLNSTAFLRVYAISAPISAVPTPGAAALIGLGGLAACRRRRA